MGKRIKLHLGGQRMSWTVIRMAIFVTLMALYAGSPIFALVMLAFVIGYVSLMEKDNLKERKESQLTREVIEVYPAASADQLRKEYKSLRCREMRLDALLYVIFAAYAALWSVLLDRAGSAYSSWICVAALLVTALVLLIRSFLPGTGKKPVPFLENYIKKRENQEKFVERLDKPDLRRCGSAVCITDLESAPTLETACEDLRPRLMKKSARVILTIFRAIVVVTLFMWVLLSFAMGTWYLIVGLVFVTGYLMYVVFMPLAGKSGMIRYNLLKNPLRRLKKKGVLIHDRALSAIPSEVHGTTLEICFEKTGTILCFCSVKDYMHLRDLRDREAFLLRDDKRFYSVSFLKDASATAVSPEEEGSPAIQTAGEKTSSRTPTLQAPAIPALEEEIARVLAEGGIPSDEQLREAARKRLEMLDPALEKEWGDELRELDYLHDSRKFVDGMAAERDRASTLLSLTLDHLRAPARFSDQLRMDDEAMKNEVTREEILARKKVSVPFRAYLPLLLSVAAVIVGIPIIALIEKNTGAELGWLKVLLSAVSGLVAMRLANVFLNTIKVKKDFKKLQKAYSDPEFWSCKIDIMKYELFRDAFRNARNHGGGET